MTGPLQGLFAFISGGADAQAAADRQIERAKRAHARRGDPDTSHEAAAKITPKLTEIQEKVLSEFRAAGLAGLTDYDLERRLGSHGSTYRTRRAELVAKGLVVNSGRKAMQQGGNRIVWLLAGTGEEK